MAKGVRRETVERIDIAGERHPFALGPILGKMAYAINLSPKSVSTMVGTHEQTVFRWMFGNGMIATPYMVKVSRLIAVLSWILTTKRPPLFGTITERETQFARYVNDFKEQSTTT